MEEERVGRNREEAEGRKGGEREEKKLEKRMAGGRHTEEERGKE